MSEVRKASHKLLLQAGGKRYRLSLYPASLWPEESGGEDLYRLRVNGVWHCPSGKYSFLHLSAVTGLIASLLNGDELPAPPAAPDWIVPGAELRVSLGACMDGIPLHSYRAIARGFPQLGPDGRYYIECRVSTLGWRFVPVDDAEPFRRPS